MQIKSTAGNFLEVVEAFSYWSGAGTLIFFLLRKLRIIGDQNWI